MGKESQTCFLGLGFFFSEIHRLHQQACIGLYLMNLRAEAEKRGVQYIERPNGHIQLKGPLLVNYYPDSKTKTAYVAGTTSGAVKKHVTPQQALEMCIVPPTCAGEKDSRGKRNGRQRRAKMLLKITNCFWCKRPLTLDNSTIEHIIPLSRGGLDNPNNRTLACAKC